MAKSKTKFEKKFSLTQKHIEIIDELKVRYGNIQSDVVAAALEKLHSDYKEGYSDKLQQDLRTLTMEVLLENQKLNFRISQLEKDQTSYHERFESFRSQINLHTAFMKMMKKDWRDWMRLFTESYPNPKFVKKEEESVNELVKFNDEVKTKK